MDIKTDVKTDEPDVSLKASIEAILFTMGEAVSGERMAQALQIEEEELDRCMEELAADYEQKERGIRLISLDGAWQLCTKKEYYSTLVQIAKVPKKQVLTDVLMETLAIIAYRQPVTKQEIEKIRGVKSDHAVNKLIEYGLVCEAGRLDAPGRPLMLATTEEFLRRFGVGGMDELPQLPPETIADFRSEAMKEALEQYPEEEKREEE
jgi:segregation and condensation protein B